jgi:deoxyribose-phosphate aldolase
MNKQELARYFDHTMLKPFATQGDIQDLCREALDYQFYSVCVNPCHVALVSRTLTGSGVKTCSVVGFPLGCSTSQVKALEAGRAVEDGADEIDMVLAVGALKQGLHDQVENDIRAVVAAAGQALVKVIIEACYLSDSEKRAACSIAERAGADFVKTSTGFGSGGALVEDIRLMKSVVGDRLQIKASGGISTLEQALAMIEAGADRLGASAGVTIIGELDG